MRERDIFLDDNEEEEGLSGSARKVGGDNFVGGEESSGVRTVFR
jgi:hypothetical protein